MGVKAVTGGHQTGFMHEIGRLLDENARRGVIDRQRLLDLGLSGSSITQLTRRGFLRPIQVGVYRVAGGERGWQTDLLGATLAAGADAAASHRAAARLWGVTDVEVPVELSVPYRSSPEPVRTVVHRSTDLQPEFVTVRHGIRVTKPARTLLDLGAVATRAEVAAAVETAIVRKLVTVRGLIVVLEQLGRRGRRGTGSLRHVVEHRPLGDKRSESILESFFARLALAFGLDHVEYQYEITVDGVVRRLDFAIVDIRMGIEVDGEGVHATELGRSSDRARDRALAAIGWQIVRLGWSDLAVRPAKTLRELRTIAEQRRLLLGDRAA